MTDNTLYEIAGISPTEAIAAAELKLMLHGAPGDTGCRIEHNGNYLWFSSAYGKQHLVGIAPTSSTFMDGRECYPSKDLFDQKWPSDVITRRVAVAAMSPRLGMDWETASFAWRRNSAEKGVVVARIVRRGDVMWLEQADGTAETLEASGGAGVWRTCPEKHAEGLDMEFKSGKDTYGNYRFMCMRAGIRMRNKARGAEKTARAQSVAKSAVPPPSAGAQDSDEEPLLCALIHEHSNQEVSLVMVETWVDGAPHEYMRRLDAERMTERNGRPWVAILDAQQEAARKMMAENYMTFPSLELFMGVINSRS